MGIKEGSRVGVRVVHVVLKISALLIPDRAQACSGSTWAISRDHANSSVVLALEPNKSPSTKSSWITAVIKFVRCHLLVESESSTTCLIPRGSCNSIVVVNKIGEGVRVIAAHSVGERVLYCKLRFIQAVFGVERDSCITLLECSGIVSRFTIDS